MKHDIIVLHFILSRCFKYIVTYASKKGGGTSEKSIIGYQPDKVLLLSLNQARER